MKKIVISGGYGKLGSAIYNIDKDHHVLRLSRAGMDVEDYNSVRNAVKNLKPHYLIHTAAMTKPMIDHETYPHISIKSNIVGTCNVVMACKEFGVKLIYISTDYVYPGIDGNYKETDPVLPFTNYGWSKLGGECAVHMYDNSLIIRLCLCNWPFDHDFAFDDMIKNYIYEDGAAKIILRLLNETGVINVGGPTQSVADFVKEENSNIQTKSTDYFKDINLNTSMNLDKLDEIS